MPKHPKDNITMSHLSHNKGFLVNVIPNFRSKFPFQRCDCANVANSPLNATLNEFRNWVFEVVFKKIYCLTSRDESSG